MMSASGSCNWLLAEDAPLPDCRLVITSLHIQPAAIAATAQHIIVLGTVKRTERALHQAGEEAHSGDVALVHDQTAIELASSSTQGIYTGSKRKYIESHEGFAFRRVHSMPLGQHFLYFRSHLCSRWQGKPSCTKQAYDSSRLPGLIYEVEVSVSSDEENQALQQALDFMYSTELPELSHAELVELLKLADKLQGPALTAAVVQAWQGIKGAPPLPLSCSLLRDATFGSWAWSEPLHADCSTSFSSAVDADPEVAQQSTRSAVQTALGDALAVANTPALLSLLLGLPHAALLWWLHDMEGLATDSEDTVLYLVNKWVTAHLASLTQAGLQQLRSAVRMQILSPLYQACVLPHMPWCAMTLQEVLTLQHWVAAGEALRQHLSAHMPDGWVLGPRAASAFQAPDPELRVSVFTLGDALREAPAAVPSKNVCIKGTAVIRSGIELFVSLEGYSRDPARPNASAYWCGLTASPGLANGIIAGKYAVHKVKLVSGKGKSSTMNGVWELGSGWGESDWWGKPPAGSSMMEEESWGMVFDAEGTVVCVVAEGACVSLA